MQFDSMFPLSVKKYSKKGGYNMLITSSPYKSDFYFFLVKYLTCNLQVSWKYILKVHIVPNYLW